MMHHFLHWTLKWSMTLMAVGAFVDMCRTVNRPLATRYVVRGRRRFRKTQVQNVLDGAGAIWGFLMIASVALALWII